jgi:preprotein translocase subunit Sss1
MKVYHGLYFLQAIHQILMNCAKPSAVEHLMVLVLD